ncbi:maleylacetoacetate isomerase [Roseospira goensis]|uniref:Maleylacetoacetate isomerase/maleylpyruvate isomerase n=1 Tax=Roseospira goensis TaxID=391922 RepID=A0A7W6S279_9PROT|nr:maleylacetoacetate isomerase [Roseospira goensis]MBB4287553.1 maleylacetoacetate isomerase/maleylpyruvate isomerase [Roseospira goensis]
MRLYTYWRSSAAQRVRIALHLKGVAYDPVPVHLRRGEQRGAAHAARNPQRLVPALELDDGTVLTQSLAIIEYLEETHPAPPLLPADARGRARVRALAQAVACDIHPVQNLRVLSHLTGACGLDEDTKTAWARHWIETGLAAVERLLADSAETGRFCHGDTPTLADCCLIPQLFNARRFGCDLSALETVGRIDSACAALPAFRRAAPDAQPDAE